MKIVCTWPKWPNQFMHATAFLQDYSIFKIICFLFSCPIVSWKHFHRICARASHGGWSCLFSLAYFFLPAAAEETLGNLPLILLLAIDFVFRISKSAGQFCQYLEKVMDCCLFLFSWPVESTSISTNVYWFSLSFITSMGFCATSFGRNHCVLHDVEY